MGLYEVRSLRVRQDLEEIVVGDEVEPGEHVPFRLEVLLQGSLHRLQLVVDFNQKIEQAGCKREQKLSGTKEKRKFKRFLYAEFTLFYSHPVASGSLFSFLPLSFLPL